jgi:hypothetical protein
MRPKVSVLTCLAMLANVVALGSVNEVGPVSFVIAACFSPYQLLMTFSGAPEGHGGNPVGGQPRRPLFGEHPVWDPCPVFSGATHVHAPGSGVRGKVVQIRRFEQQVIVDTGSPTLILFDSRKCDCERLSCHRHCFNASQSSTFRHGGSLHAALHSSPVIKVAAGIFRTSRETHTR